MFTCAACTRATSFDRGELVKRWGEEGRVAALVERLGCSNCRAKRRRRAEIRVDVIGVYVSGSEQRRAKLGPIDRLMFDIERLKPGPIS
jgi:hypothetical protein